MTLSDDCPVGRSQFLTQSRVKSGWTSLARRVRQRHSNNLYRFVLSPEVLANLPKPEFHIGDNVSDHWFDEFDKECIEFGKIVGVCWHPREQRWSYLVDWYKGGSPDFVYPCFDGHLLIGGDLRLEL
jgi:hypothetical protein